MKELQPLNENVLLELTEEFTETKTTSRIIIPDSAKEKPQMAKDKRRRQKNVESKS